MLQPRILLEVHFVNVAQPRILLEVHDETERRESVTSDFVRGALEFFVRSVAHPRVLLSVQPRVLSVACSDFVGFFILFLSATSGFVARTFKTGLKRQNPRLHALRPRPKGAAWCTSTTSSASTYKPAPAHFARLRLPIGC
jgi:hypothetical protein